MTAPLDSLTLATLTCHRCNLLPVDHNAPLPVTVFPFDPIDRGLTSPHRRILVLLEAPSPGDDRARSWGVSGPGRMMLTCLTKSGVSEEEVAMAGAVQCAPTRPSDINTGHVEACGAIRTRLIAAIDPEWIVVCGRWGVKGLWEGKVKDAKLSKVTGRWWRGRAGPAKDRSVFVTSSPATALRTGKHHGLLSDLDLFARVMSDPGSRLARQMEL